MRVAVVVVATFLVLLPSAVSAAKTDPSEIATLPGEEISLWPGDAPGSQEQQTEETLAERSSDPDRHDRAYLSVVRPSLTVLRPDAANGSAVIVVPGGSYQRVVIDKEGLDIARWLNGLGVTAFVLKYRLPGGEHGDPVDAPLEDLQRAVRVVRSRADEFDIDPGRIGLIGFSAGGHLAGSLAANHGSNLSARVDPDDRFSARPDFMMLVYPVVGKAFVRSDALAASPEMDRMISKNPLEPGLSGDWPPTILIHTGDDFGFSAEGTVSLYLALRAAGVPAEIHVFERGGHGFGIRNATGPVAVWPELCGAWMRSLGVLESP